MLGFSRCWGARELTSWGGAAGSPRRRRGGGRETVLGGVAKGGSSSARGKWVQGSRGDAWGGGEAGGGLQPSQSGGRAALTAGSVKQRSRQEEGESGLNCNFRNSRDLTINQL